MLLRRRTPIMCLLRGSRLSLEARRFGVVHVASPLDAEALLTHQTRRSAARLRCTGSRTWFQGVDWSRREFGARARRAKRYDRTAVTTTAASRIDAVRVLAGNDTSAPLLSQPHINPHRWPDGHCASFVQLTMAPEAPFLGPSAFVVWHSALPKAAKSQTTRVRCRASC